MCLHNDVPPTCFALYKAIIREAVYQGMQIQQILHIFDRIRCICIPLYTASLMMAL
jgi:hypothetical protein